MRFALIIILTSICIIGYSQNCEYLKTQGDSIQAKACLIGEGASFYFQGSKAFQQIYDSAIETCPYFAAAYHAKSVAYLKSGNFVTWKKLIDKAVELDPVEYLGTRGWCRFKFVRDYQGAISDIEQLNKLINYDIGYSSDGEYHLEIARAICYSHIGDNKKALEIYKSKLGQENYQPGLFDYYHLGVICNQEGKYEEAISALSKQIELNKIAEAHYHLAIAYKNLKRMEDYKLNLLTSKELYHKQMMMTHEYTSTFDKVYLITIEQEIENGL